MHHSSGCPHKPRPKQRLESRRGVNWGKELVPGSHNTLYSPMKVTQNGLSSTELCSLTDLPLTPQFQGKSWQAYRSTQLGGVGRWPPPAALTERHFWKQMWKNWKSSCWGALSPGLVESVKWLTWNLQPESTGRESGLQGTLRACENNPSRTDCRATSWSRVYALSFPWQG